MSIVQRLTKVAKALLGTSNESILRGYKPLVEAVNALESEMTVLSDAELRGRSHALRDAVRAKEKTLDQAKVEAFALAREAADRRIGMWGAIADAKAILAIGAATKPHRQWPPSASASVKAMPPGTSIYRPRSTRPSAVPTPCRLRPTACAPTMCR